MTDYTPAQQKLIEKYRDCNTDEGSDWHGNTIEDFCEVAKSFGVIVESGNVQFSGFWSQGDGASFIFSEVSAYDVIMASIKVEQEKPYGDEPAGYAAKFAALGTLLLDTFNPYVLTCPEGRGIAEAYAFRAIRSSHHYSHSNTVTVDAEFDHNAYDPNDSEPQRAVWSALADKIWGIDTKHRPDERPTLRKEIDDAVKAIADALYRSLEEEYEYLNSDEAVWETITANDWDKDVDEDEEEELEEAA